jgi:hypothetical protein
MNQFIEFSSDELPPIQLSIKGGSKNRREINGTYEHRILIYLIVTWISNPGIYRL